MTVARDVDDRSSPTGIERDRGEVAPVRSLWLSGLLSRHGTFAALILIVGAASLLSPSFRTSDNWLNILRAVAIVGVMALGQTFVALGGGLADLSAGSTVAMSAVLTLGLQPDLGVAGALVAGFGCGLTIGLVNGILVGLLRLNSIVTTIGTGVVLGGLALAYTDGNTQFSTSEAFTEFGTGEVVSLPSLVLVFLVVAVVAHGIVGYTVFGRQLLATGGNYEASRASSVPVRRVVLLAFVAAGFASALSGALTAALLGQVDYDTGSTYTFASIAAVAVGGTSLFGGSGSAVKTVTGIMMIGVLNNIVVLLGWPLNVQVVVTGSVILLAVLFDMWLRRGRA